MDGINQVNPKASRLFALSTLCDNSTLRVHPDCCEVAGWSLMPVSLNNFASTIPQGSFCVFEKPAFTEHCTRLLKQKQGRRKKKPKPFDQVFLQRIALLCL